METVSCDSPEFSTQLMSVDEALAKLQDQVVPPNASEVLPINQILGKVLAKSVVSEINVPPHANSSMDGYAIRQSDWLGENRVELPVSQRIPAGTVGSELQKKSAARIFTGAPIPEGADAVVMQEVCTARSSDGFEYITISNLPSVGENIRLAGEDIKVGSLILDSGHLLRSQDIGLLASIGINQVEVFKSLRVAVFFTGDEIVEPGEPLESGQIYNSNRYTLTSMLHSWGCEVVDLGSVKDSLEATKAALAEAATCSDLIMTSGGVSVGEEDHIRPALEALGELAVWRISIKPGKPLAFGSVNQVPFIGLPGNPVSVFATACVLARPYIMAMRGASFESISGVEVVSGFNLGFIPRRREYLRVKLEKTKQGVQKLVKFDNQSSGVLTSASWADGFAVVEIGQSLKAGDKVEFIPFSFFGI